MKSPPYTTEYLMTRNNEKIKILSLIEDGKTLVRLMENILRSGGKNGN